MTDSKKSEITDDERREVTNKVSDAIDDFLGDLDFWFDKKGWPDEKRTAALKATGLSDISDAWEEFLHEDDR